MEQVSWNEVQNFLKKINARYPGHYYRLPFEAEWEYAARGGILSKGFVYSGSNNLDEVGWYFDNSRAKTHPVGQKKPNELGLFDMSGNVWEWCADWYGTSFSQPRPDLRLPESGSRRIYRGGSWLYFLQHCRIAIRNGDYPDYRFDDLGFRLASSSQ